MHIVIHHSGTFTENDQISLFVVTNSCSPKPEIDSMMGPEVVPRVNMCPPCVSPLSPSPTHRSPQPAFPASRRADPERLEETLNHLFPPSKPPYPCCNPLRGPTHPWGCSSQRLRRAQEGTNDPYLTGVFIYLWRSLIEILKEQVY